MENLEECEKKSETSPDRSFEEVTATSQTSTGTWVDEDFASGLDLTDEDILSIQKLKPEEPQPAGDSFFSELRSNLSVSRSDITFCEDRVASVTGLPRPSSPGAETDYPLSPQLNRSIDKATAVEVPSTSSSPSSSQKSVNMGGSESKKDATTIPRYIMSEDPRDFLASPSRPRVSETEVTGNCRPWSDHVYFKLFLDTESRNATLVVLKCDISYVNVFTDQEHTLYKSRFIGGKTDGICEQFVFDLMKSDWEAKIPQSQAIELNVDIVMSSSPIHTCADSLVKLIQLEKSYLKFRKFDGKLNVMLRFAHGYGWDAKEDSTRQHVHEGLRKLFVEGVNLEVMSWETIVEEMRVDGIPTSDEENIRTIIRKRLTWNDLRANKSKRCTDRGEGARSRCILPTQQDSSGPALPPFLPVLDALASDDDVVSETTMMMTVTRSRSTTSSRSSEEDFEYLSDDDMYYVFLLDKLDQILANHYLVNHSVVQYRKRQPSREKKCTIFKTSSR